MPGKDEREFLHDVSNPLAIIQGKVQGALRKMLELKDLDPRCVDVIEKLGRAIEACERIGKKVAERKAVLLNEEDKAVS